MVSEKHAHENASGTASNWRIAENYYTADYPDDEVASDDEFGLNPYSFRNNASDVEEYDLDDDDEADKDGFKAFRGPDGLLSKHL